MLAPVDVTTIRIETPRLVLRPWQETDLEDFYEYASVDGVGQMAGWQPHESKEKTRQILDMFIRKKKVLALELKDSGKVIGSLGLEEMETDPVEGELLGREIGYVLSKDYWGQGLMPEAVKAVIDYGFQALGLDYLTCAHFKWNHQSQRVIDKCGFRYWGDAEFETRMGTKERTWNYIIYNQR